LDVVFNRFLVKPVRVIGTAGLMAAALIGLGYVLFGIQRPFEIYGEGTLQTSDQQHVFAQIEGEVDQLLVEEGSLLEKDQRLIVISSENLEKELITIEGEIEEAKQELSNLLLADFNDPAKNQPALDETKTASDIERLKIRLKTLESRLAFFEDKKSDLVVNAPIAGQVTTTNLRQRLTGRPINRGDLLMTVSDTRGEWEVELEVPDNRIEFVKNAEAENGGQPLEVVFRLASDSRKTYRGQLKRLDYRSDERAEAEKTIVLAYVDIDESDLGDSLRLGTRVYGKINCGERSNFFLLTYEARNKIREWLFR
jgi:multidrug efflux pump subunit AcrA (membrane-fusion protein)